MCGTGNACGPWWLHKSLRAELSRHFNPACGIHDLKYQNKIGTRKQVDKEFLEHMLRIAGDDKRLRRWAYTFYYSVRIGGGFSWGKK